jgi:EcoEI R protein C-terminal
MNANRSEVVRTPGEATNTRFHSAEGIYKAKAKLGFESENPASTDLFACICTYLRTFALKPSASLRDTSPIPTKAISCISKTPNKTFDWQTRTAEVQCCAPAKHAFDEFARGRTLRANQHELINMIVEHLTERGVMDPRPLYEPPFTDLDPLGAEGVFGQAEAVQLVDILDDVRRRAAA